ncbi:single-stranded-DNA-specific exonuclease RecJ [Candidatus Gullanella endobia]|uniref:single-stranded-DNA-specific exonuclease RecJ n=1 Tax=Candidatus Gullanella endobia TaxID=1070130 RepID=UPI0008341547|nr:single-stranded-DNA-specific exonuclease RecJ [Candidatus Gullanella endobia]
MNIKTKLKRRPIGDVSVLSNSDIPPLLKRLYIQRGICSLSELERGTCGLIAYYKLSGIEKAVDLLLYALEDQRRIIVVGDFDADGATSTALTVLALQKMGTKKIDFLVPNRFEDGYGLSPKLVEQAAALGAQIILTVDNGISSHAGVTLAHEKNIIVLITDHHLPSKILPDADAIVNPNLHDCTFSSKSLAGVGVAFYLMLALRARLNKLNWFSKKGIEAPKLAEFLDLVALGTVADMVPLDTNNRILVHQGLSRIRAGFCRPGIRALIEVANRNITQLYASDLGFSLGPRLNAAGRLDDMSVGVALLLSEDLPKARILALELNALNQTRRKIEKKMEKKALSLCQKIISNKQKLPFGLVIYHDQWHQGVVGILASRIKEHFHRPVIAFASMGEGILKGSGRSIAGLHMRDLLEQLDMLYPGMILKFGGHTMAAGLILEKVQFKQFCQRFSALVTEWLDPSILEGVIWSDGELSANELSIATAELLRDGGPWGQAFPDPLFDGRFTILSQRLVRKKHLRLLLEPEVGGPILDGIAFNIDLQFWPDNSIHTVELAYKLEINEFRGNRSLQLLIQNIWPL